MRAWLRRLRGFWHRHDPAIDGRVDALEREQVRLIARLEALHLLDEPAARARFDRELRELERQIAGKR